MKTLFFYFDFLSPYSYLAWQWFNEKHEELRSQGVQIHVRPVSMAIIIKKYVDKGPGEIPPKRDFLFKVVLHRAQALKIPLTCPSKIPFDSYMALRYVASLSSDPRCQVSFVTKIFSAIWGQGLSLTDEMIAQSLSELLASDQVQTVGQLALSRETSGNMKRFMKEAQDYGVFGVPSFVLVKEEGPELFWGHDAIPALESALRGEAWYNQVEYAKFTRSLNDVSDKSI